MKKIGVVKQYKELKGSLLKRCNFKCMICGKYLKRSKDLVVHHLDGEEKKFDNRSFYRKNNQFSNVLILCRHCHSGLHFLGKKNRKLGKRLVGLRNKVIKELWESSSFEIEMSEIGKVFGLSTVQVWRILNPKKENQKVVTNKTKNL